jgi:myo-inositol catabolism protein IolC
MTLGYERPLYMLAFDHRGSFQSKLFGIQGTPTDEEHARISDAKQVIYEGFEVAVERGAPEGAGLLVDEEYGANVARATRAAGFPLAMPVEKSGQKEFDFEFGDDFGSHIEAFDPSFAKVLVRYNPDGEEELNRRQSKRLAQLSHWLRERGRKFLYELLVPATPQQLELVGGDHARYDLEIRPDLVRRVIEESQAAGVEADIWKIEGLDRREDCERVARAARAGGRDGVACIVLGRGADEAAVVRWLEAGAGVPGYIGFAVGRTIWWDALVGYVGGSVSRRDAAEQIAGGYLRLIEAYAAAAVA